LARNVLELLIAHIIEGEIELTGSIPPELRADTQIPPGSAEFERAATFTPSPKCLPHPPRTSPTLCRCGLIAIVLGYAGMRSAMLACPFGCHSARRPQRCELNEQAVAVVLTNAHDGSVIFGSISSARIDLKPVEGAFLIGPNQA